MPPDLQHHFHRPILIIIGLFLCLVLIETVLLSAPPLYLIAGLVVIVAWSGAALASTVAALRSAWRRNVPQACAMAILPLVFLASALWPKPVIFGARVLGDRLHFAIARPRYLAQIRALPQTGQPRLAIIEWGGFIAMTIGVVYDESDEIGLPRSQQSTTWNDRAAGSELSCGYAVNAAVGDHFYLVDFGC
ncbi:MULTISPECIES: hypothetical protein [Nitrospirillum]|nr:hypothetical protein [Nitrospirillum amazonense]